MKLRSHAADHGAVGAANLLYCGPGGQSDRNWVLCKYMNYKETMHGLIENDIRALVNLGVKSGGNE